MNYSKYQTLVQILCPKVVKRLLMLYTSNIAQSLSEISNIIFIILVRMSYYSTNCIVNPILCAKIMTFHVLPKEHNLVAKVI